MRRALELEPGYGDAYYNLGIVLGNQGRLEESIQQFRKAAELLPDYPDALYNLGAALRLAGRLEDAEAEVRRALRLKPDHVQALEQLGSVLALQGRMEEAEAQFRRGLALEPSSPVLHFRMGSALLLRGGRPAEAAGHLRQAVHLRPDWPEALNALAWLLATSPDPMVRDAGEAQRLAGRAAELTGHRSPKVLDTLAAAQAAAGRFDHAARTARTALELAMQARADTLARVIRERLRLFERQKAYTEPG